MIVPQRVIYLYAVYVVELRRKRNKNNTKIDDNRIFLIQSIQSDLIIALSHTTQQLYNLKYHAHVLLLLIYAYYHCLLNVKERNCLRKIGNYRVIFGPWILRNIKCSRLDTTMKLLFKKKN